MRRPICLALNALVCIALIAIAARLYVLVEARRLDNLGALLIALAATATWWFALAWIETVARPRRGASDRRSS